MRLPCSSLRVSVSAFPDTGNCGIGAEIRVLRGVDSLTAGATRLFGRCSAQFFGFFPFLEPYLLPPEPPGLDRFMISNSALRHRSFNGSTSEREARDFS